MIFGCSPAIEPHPLRSEPGIGGQGPGYQPDSMPGSPADSCPADSCPSELGEQTQRSRRRPRRRELFCPSHPEQKLISVSGKHHLYLTDVGQLVIRGLSRKKADEILAAFNHVLPLNDEWLECFWCDDCQNSVWWHVKRKDRLSHSLHPAPRELWEQATGVIRPEGNPTISEFSRRHARASGVSGRRQFRFL
jgi:hypothetical protein